MYCKLCTINKTSGDICGECERKADEGFPGYVAYIAAIRGERRAGARIHKHLWEPDDISFAQEMGWIN